jgi:hypothetical protein
VFERDPQSPGSTLPCRYCRKSSPGTRGRCGGWRAAPSSSPVGRLGDARSERCGSAIGAVPRRLSERPDGVSTGSWIEPDVERRVRLLSTWGSLPPESRPDFASVNPWGGAGDGPKDRAAAGRSRREDAPPLARRRSRRLADARVRAGTWLRRPYRTRRHVDDARRQFLPETMLNWLMRRWSRPPDRSGRPAVEARLAKRKRPANEQEAYDAEGR